MTGGICCLLYISGKTTTTSSDCLIHSGGMPGSGAMLMAMKDRPVTHEVFHVGL